MANIEPKPDPWDPPRAATAQAAGTAAGLAGVIMMGTDSDPGNIGQSIAWLPDPNQVFASVAHVLGFKFNQADAFSWGFVLVVLCVALNLLSLYWRYRYAEWVKPRWDEQIAKLEKEAELGRRMQGATPSSLAQGSGGGAA